MAFLFASPKTPPETAGPAAEPEVASRYPKLNAAAVKALGFEHSLIMTPMASPEVEIPYYVRQAGGVSGDYRVLRTGRPHYYLVTFNTHSGYFTVSEFKEKQIAKQAYADAMIALSAAAPGYKSHGQTKLKYARSHLGCFRQTPLSVRWQILSCGGFSASRRVQVKDRFVNFHGQRNQFGRKYGAIIQAMTNSKAASLTGLNGSWENMLEYARITHEAGSQQASIGASVADFIGLWGSVTGNVASLHLASSGFIDPAARFQNCWKSLTAAAFKSRHNPFNNTLITYGYDTTCAWV